MPEFLYRGPKTKEISFPLGGIGTGSIGLAGNGRLIDWEIYNRPNKGSLNGFSHFAIKAERDGSVIDARVLNGDLAPPYTGALNRPQFQSYGFGPHRGTMAGVPHFENVEFKGEFPLAELEYIDGMFPGKVSMTAFNPFIPLNDKDSSLPVAMFEINVENTTAGAIVYTIAPSLGSPFPADKSINEYQDNGLARSIKLGSLSIDEADPAFGDLCVATDSEDCRYQEYWYRGKWFDSLEVYWREFVSSDPLKNRTYSDSSWHPRQGDRDMCTLAAKVSVQPGERRSLRFVISWSFPNFTNYWKPVEDSCGCEDGCGCEDQRSANTWKNYYATVFDDSRASAAYALDHWTRLFEETRLFKDALFSSTLPAVALESVSANLSVLNTPTTVRLTDGSFYGFEGCHCDSGCCEGSCTHVWNYAYALPFLFPKLERSMRELDFRYNQREDGGMVFRLQLPIGRERSQFRPCADGEFGGVIKTYRDWKICGDTDWLRSIWPAVKKSIEYAWAESNADRWDADRDGVLEGRQHHTLDMELFGPNSWLTGFYLGALKAGAEMAEHLGEADTAADFRALFDQGKAWVDENLFNGEYYHQLVDVSDKNILEQYVDKDFPGYHHGSVMEAYWNDEAKEIKYQIAEGSEIDQVNAQWHANLCGLGDIFDPEQRKTALRSMYKYNFKESMRLFFNPCRNYCLNDEAGLVICDWPEDKYRPIVPLPYSGETQNGYEYQAAILMIQEGLVREGMTAVKAIRDRYDGEKRNPWNEFECGNNYARSMASYSMIPTFSGFTYDMVKGEIGFAPIVVDDGDALDGGFRGGDDPYRTIWSLDSGWGVFDMSDGTASLTVLSGSLEINRIAVPGKFSEAVLESTGGSTIKVAAELAADGTGRSEIVFQESLAINGGEKLVLPSAQSDT